MPDDLAPDLGHIEEVAWADVKVGHIVRDKKDRLHTVVDEQHGWLLLEPVRGGERWAHCPVAMLDKPVSIYVPSESECRVLLHEELGARLLRDIEEREHTMARALSWRVDPIPRRAVALRDHIDWLHGVNVDDVLRRWQGTPANPATKTDKKVKLEELCQAHDEMHERPDLWPHNMAHHHAVKE